nr:AIR synthase related protein [Candidatus Njordarchaeum guaymaensis]
MNLEFITESIRRFVGVTRKMPILEITKRMHEVAGSIVIPDAKVIESFGEDCAVIDIGSKERYLLFKTEEMWYKLVEADPKFAGYCSVLVNVNDVTVKGGTPIAIVDTLATASKDIRDKIVDGIIEGCRKFNVPIVGGHLSPDSPFNRLTVSVIGVVAKKSLIRSDTAQPGNMILVAIDLDGHFHNLFKFAWDTTTHKSKDDIETRSKAIHEIADNGMATAAKDISNPGVVGTLGMLLDASNVGGEIDVAKIPKPPKVNIEDWLKAYPGFGVVLTARPENVDRCIAEFRKREINAGIVGKVGRSRRLFFKAGESSVQVFDFRVDRLSGRPLPRHRRGTITQ